MHELLGYHRKPRSVLDMLKEFNYKVQITLLHAMYGVVKKKNCKIHAQLKAGNKSTQTCFRRAVKECGLGCGADQVKERHSELVGC